MTAPKRSHQDGDPPSATPANVTAPDIEGLVTLRNDCLAKLNSIATRMQESTHQASADLARSLSEAQLNVQVSNQQRMLDFAFAAQKLATSTGPSAELNEISQMCAKGFEASQETARKSIEDAHNKIAATLNDNSEAANRDWEAACSAYVKGLQDRVSRLDPSAVDPRLLTALGQSLMWIATHVRRRESA